MRAAQIALQVGPSRPDVFLQVSGEPAPVLEVTVLTVPHPSASAGQPAATPVAGGTA
jgi:hypothetical protein